MKEITRFVYVFLLFMAGWGVTDAQVSISFCPDIKSDQPPTVYSGNAFKLADQRTCGTCSSTCEMPIKDPIGGFRLAYYVHRDKETGKLAFVYEVGDGADDLKSALNASAEFEKHKLQDKKLGAVGIWVERNVHLATMGKELEDILKASYGKFKDLETQVAPWGELAFVFETLLQRESYLKLSVQYSGNQDRGYLDAMYSISRDLLPDYALQVVGDSVFLGAINPEYPSFEFKVAKSRKTIEWSFFSPHRSNPPTLIYSYSPLRRSKQGIDTLVSIPLRSGKQGYAIGLQDESKIERFSLEGINQQLRVGDTSIFVIEATPEMNNSVVSISAEDIHGNTVSKKLHLLEFEKENPKFGIFNFSTNDYRIPGEEVIMDKYNQRFQLLGRVVDASPIRSVTVNGRPAKWDEKNEFVSSLLPSDNGKKMKVEVVDAHGNKAATEFKITFKESGADRKMKLEVEEEFSSRNESYLVRNGKNGLILEIKTDKFFVQKVPVHDSSASAAAADEESETSPKRQAAVVPFGLPTMNFNTDFELELSYSMILEGSRCFLTFGMDDSRESYFFIFGEGTNLYLGQCENNLLLGSNDGTQPSYYRPNAPFNYLQRQQVTPGFFDRGTGTEYNLKVRRYNEYYIGAKDDPKDWLFIELDNEKDPIVKLQMPLTGSKVRIPGTKAGIALWDDSQVAISKITYKKGQQDQAPAFFEDKDIEKYCFTTCYNTDTTKKKDFFECLTPHYQALIVANGDFDDRISDLPSAVETGTQLKDLLINEYQFSEDQVTFMPNATKEQFLGYLEKNLPSHSTKETRLLIWVISHGTQDKTIEFRDAPVQSDDIWNRLNRKKTDGNYAFECKQILFVLDACFSGEMTPSKQQEYNPSRTICDANAKGSRLAVTSASDKATRESQLSKEMVKHLSQNPQKYLTIDKLFDLAKKDFLKEMSGNTDPTLSVFQPTNHEANGSFLFIKRKFFQ